MSSGIESYNIRMCLVYARSDTSYSMYTFMSRWLPKTLCHNVCGISSELVTAVAVYSQHSVPALIWHLLWTFLLLWQRTERSNIHWTSGMCCEILGLSYTHCQEYLDNNIYIIVVLWKTLSMHMFEHSIYNRIVMENSICCFIFHNVELHF